MSTHPSPPPAKANAMARKSSPDEIAAVTGWDIKAVTAAIRAGALPGCRFIPSEANPSTGRYLCAWAPFYSWWVDGIETAPPPVDVTERFIHRMQSLEAVSRVLASEAV